MNWVTDYLTQSDCYRAAKPLKAQGIVIHSTGVNQKRIEAYTTQWNRPGVRCCVHGFLGRSEAGETEFRQTLPFDVCCWGCGKGAKGSYNDSCLQFEICEDRRDGSWCRETYEAALDVCTVLCRRFSIAPEAVVCHSEAHALGFASNHADVLHWWPAEGLSMDGFRAELNERLKEDEDMTGEEIYQCLMAYLASLPASEYAQSSCAKAVRSGIFADGDGDGALDAPRAPLLRQELAVLFDRMGLLN